MKSIVKQGFAIEEHALIAFGLRGDASLGRRVGSLGSPQGVFEAAKLPQKRLNKKYEDSDMEITAKRPWLSSMGDVPANMDYFQGSMVEMLENNAKLYPTNIAFDFMRLCKEIHIWEMAQNTADEFNGNVCM